MASHQKQEPPPRVPIVCGPDAFSNLTNINRRTCKRVVPMKVLGLGPSRTGTSSLRQALIDLGYTGCYHYAALLQENPRDAEMWAEALEAKYEGKGKPFQREDWDQLLGHCMAVTDTPCTAFYREFLESYPDAKVIVTVRDSPKQWWDSQMRTIMPFFDYLVLPPSTWKMWLWRKFLPPQTAFDRVNWMLQEHWEMYSTLGDDLRNGTQNGIKWYENHVEEIKRIVPKDRLLIMNVKEGWEPLCKFLGHDVPPWEFPQANTTAQWEVNVGALYKGIDQQVYWTAVKTVGPVVVGVVAIAGFFALRTKGVGGWV